MNSPSDENKKRQSEETSPQEDEANVLEASTVKCFPAVKRSFRQKQCNWRWRWRYFTRALQPISEQGENTKDDTNKVDDNDNNSAVDGNSENNSESLEIKEQESNNQHLVDSRHNIYSENNSNVDRGQERNKEDYSACIKLIEKFQEAVLDNAVRVIQAAFKRFRERRRFLKLKKAATVIQRSVRRWLQLRHSNGLPKLQSAKPECDHDSGMQQNCFNCNELDGEVTFSHVERQDTTEEKGSVDESFEGERADSPWTQEQLEKDVDGVPESTSEGNEQFENSFESFDAASLSGSADNLSDTDVCIDRSEEISPASDPDSLSLADSGIDMCSDTTQEVAIIDDCECSKTENTSTTSSKTVIEKVVSHQNQGEFS
ncbi:hypothetical protein ACROYT_G024921 [Oculina patagonica]